MTVQRGFFALTCSLVFFYTSFSTAAPKLCGPELSAYDCELLEFEERLKSQAAEINKKQVSLFKKYPAIKPQKEPKANGKGPSSALKPSHVAEKPSEPLAKKPPVQLKGFHLGLIHHIPGDFTDTKSATFLEIGYLTHNRLIVTGGLNLIRDRFQDPEFFDAGSVTLGYVFSTGIFAAFTLGKTGGEESFQGLRFGFVTEFRLTASFLIGFYNEDQPVEFLGFGLGFSI